jgi:hypothetical protein
VQFECDRERLISNDLEIGKHIYFLLHENSFRGIAGIGHYHFVHLIRAHSADVVLECQAQMVVKEVRYIIKN